MNKEWIILDVETTGLVAPIYAVEVAAQLMDGNSPKGEPFSLLIDHGIEIPDASTRIHGYTRDILMRDGHPPAEAYALLREYVEERPVVSYNLPYDWDDVLVPEWNRLGLSQVGVRGFCALRLTRRLLDPVAAGNCKLQTIRRYYDLPERAAHSAKGDVLTLVDLFLKILFPLAEQRSLDDWDALFAYAEEDWYPSRIAFGKHKGRDFRDAREDKDFRSYIEWLSGSDNPRSSTLGAWYLANLDAEPQPAAFVEFAEPSAGPPDGLSSPPGEAGMTIWSDPEADRLKPLVSGARARLAEAQTELGILKAKVDGARARIFEALRPLYEKRESLNLRIKYRRIFIDTLLSGGEEEAEAVDEQFRQAEEENRQEYERTAGELSGKKKLSGEDQKRLSKIWKKLVCIFHPDRYPKDAEKRKRYEQLTALINSAKTDGDLDALEEIAADPEAFARRQGLGELDLSDREESESLRRLWQALQAEIISTIEAIEAIKQSPDHELAVLAEKDESFLPGVISGQEAELDREIEELSDQSRKLGEEVEELTGEPPPE